MHTAVNHRARRARLTIVLLVAALLPMPSAGAQQPFGDRLTTREPSAAPPLHVARRTPTAGEWIELSASGPRSWRNARTVLRWKRSRTAHWQRVATGRADGSGALQFRHRSSGLGRQYYRVVVPRRGRTSIEEVTVYRWFYLADLDPVATEIEGRAGTCTGSCTGFHGGSVVLGGRRYPHSWVMGVDNDGARSTTTWDASRKCRHFKATVGITDESQTSTAAFSINLGGEDRVLAQTETGQAVRVYANISFVFRFVLASMNTGTGEDLDTAWGDARVLCRSRP